MLSNVFVFNELYKTIYLHERNISTAPWHISGAPRPPRGALEAPLPLMEFQTLLLKRHFETY